MSYYILRIRHLAYVMYVMYVMHVGVLVQNELIRNLLKLKREPVVPYASNNDVGHGSLCSLFSLFSLFRGDLYDWFIFWFPFTSRHSLSNWWKRFYPIDKARALQSFKVALAVMIAAINELLPEQYFFLYAKLKYGSW